jgi:hypothetical protein
MAIRKAQTIVLQVVGDGTSTSFSVDLATNPYLVTSYGPQSGTLVNWFSDKTSAPPVTVDNDGTGSEHGNVTAALSGTVLTVTYLGTPVPLRNFDLVTVILIW